MATALLFERYTLGERLMVNNKETKVEVVQISEATLRAIIKESVQEAMALMGIQSDEPTEMQKDFNHLREWRTTVDAVKRKGLLAVVGTLVSGLIAAAYLGITHGGK